MRKLDASARQEVQGGGGGWGVRKIALYFSLACFSCPHPVMLDAPILTVSFALRNRDCKYSYLHCMPQDWYFCELEAFSATGQDRRVGAQGKGAEAGEDREGGKSHMVVGTGRN